MHIGIAFDLKSDQHDPSRPDDWQEEFDSPVTVNAIAAALRNRGHTVTELGDGRELVEKLLANPPDLVFNIAEGEGVGRSREARVPAVCELLGIPVTGSDPLTLAVGLDKSVARKLVEAAGVKVPRGFSVDPPRLRNDDYLQGIRCTLIHFEGRDPPWPCIVKPAWEGSSKGIRGKCIVRSDHELSAAIDECTGYEQPLLVEEFVVGDEVTVGMIGNDPARILGIMRIVPIQPNDQFVYSLEVKRDWRNRVRYECPVALNSDVLQSVEQAAQLAYRALGCRDVSRIDFRIRDGVPYFIEANPLPGLNPESGDLILIANAMGISHEQLIGMILDAALERLSVSPRGAAKRSSA